MDGTLPLVSIACSISGDVRVLDFHGALFRALRGLEGAYRFEIFYACADGDAAAVDSLAQLDPRIHRVPLAENADALLRTSLAGVKSDLLLLMDAVAHSPDLLPRMLELSKGPCAFVEGVPEVLSAPNRSLGWKSRSAPISPPDLLLLKRPALDALRAAALDQQPISAKLIAAKLPRAELPYLPAVSTPPAPQATLLRRIVADVHSAWKSSPHTLVMYFGSMVLAVGVFLAIWFSLQSVVVPNSVWFSWCYLIVLLHILGGSILIALGKVGALATRILTELQQRQTPTLANAERPTNAPARMPITTSKAAS